VAAYLRGQGCDTVSGILKDHSAIVVRVRQPKKSALLFVISWAA
jgi:hypothetical protein